jgi:hypothetical protein
MTFDLYDRMGIETAITVFPDGPKFKLKKNHVKILSCETPKKLHSSRRNKRAFPKPRRLCSFIINT